MSRLWSRFGIRALSVALLIVAVAGGVALGRDREAQRQDAAASAERASDEQLKERAASRAVETSRQRAAARQAEVKADASAKAAAQRARRVDDAAVRKKVEETEKKNDALVPYSGPIPASCNEYSGNRKIGCALLLDKGFGIDQMPCLDKLWSKESGWNPKAENSSSGAYGIPQAVPGSKMASVADDWRTNPATQITWGLGYIKGRYDTPCGAWQQSQNEGWY